MGARALIFLVGISCAGCPDNGTYFPKREHRIDAGTPDDCAAACAHLRELGCEEGQPTDGGASCEDVCGHTESSGAVTLDPACVTKIKSCPEIDGCTY